MNHSECPRLAALARELRALPPSLGAVRLVAVDGHAGSGKSTFAARLADRLDGAPVVHLDDLATHEDFFGWTRRLREQVLRPLAEGRPGAYDVYDWTRRAFTERRAVEPAPVVLLEGVGAGRRSVRPALARLLWMELPARESWARGRRRDGRELASFWREWELGEQRHFAADPSRPYADALVLQGETGYTVLPGPSAGG
ncbi:hypothetical protein AB0M28_31785 [Streptomyces sp. NPDC051940]|uniref:uridine kinase family protein n=1 Tax=Streptomyces sp. NPDC051940 TaxID=3155675 RepID=UPI0034306105